MDVIILDKKERPVEVRGQRYTIITFRRRAGLRSDDYGYEIKEIGVGGIGQKSREEAYSSAMNALKNYLQNETVNQHN